MIRLALYALWIGLWGWLAVSRFKANDRTGGWCSLFFVLSAFVAMSGIYSGQEL